MSKLLVTEFSKDYDLVINWKNFDIIYYLFIDKSDGKYKVKCSSHLIPETKALQLLNELSKLNNDNFKDRIIDISVDQLTFTLTPTYKKDPLPNDKVLYIVDEDYNYYRYDYDFEGFLRITEEEVNNL